MKKWHGSQGISLDIHMFLPYGWRDQGVIIKPDNIDGKINGQIYLTSTVDREKCNKNKEFNVRGHPHIFGFVYRHGLFVRY